MLVAFRFRLALAPVIGILLAVALPTEANDSVPVLSDPSQIARRAARSPRVFAHYLRQLSAEGVLSLSRSNIPALHGNGVKEAVDVLAKSVGPFIKLPEDYRHKGVLE
jgi:ABC-type hemin transport system substrate-binding protein